MVAFIPSPKHGIVHIGPLPLHAYGLMLAIGVLVATKVAETRWARTGHDPKEFGEIVVPVVIAGVIGARVYHLFTGYKWSDGGFVGTFEIWKGGLSIWGAVGGGLIAVHRARAPPPARHARAARRDRARRRARAGDRTLGQLLQPGALRTADDAAVGARDRSRAPSARIRRSTRRSIRRSSTSRCGACSCSARIVLVERRFAACKRGQAFALYVAMYTFGRIWFEALRIDDATQHLRRSLQPAACRSCCASSAPSGSSGSDVDRKPRHPDTRAPWPSP